jgi:hypothetical protein
MTSKKLPLLVVLILITAISVLAYLYFQYWYEPRLAYIETDSSKLIQIRQDLKRLKAGLREKGLYTCCIRNDCNWCAIYMGHCPCAKLVSEKGNEKSCPECAAAWNRKWGKIPGVDVDAIKVTTFGVYGFEKEGHHHPRHTH